jgi:hypothetical protein
MHWTERSTEDFLSRITFDFIAQLNRHSDVFDEDEKLTIEQMIEKARSIGFKVALVAYKADAPVNSEIFSRCWEKQSKPADFFELEEN